VLATLISDIIMLTFVS